MNGWNLKNSGLEDAGPVQLGEFLRFYANFPGLNSKIQFRTVATMQECSEVFCHILLIKHRVPNYFPRHQ